MKQFDVVVTQKVVYEFSLSAPSPAEAMTVARRLALSWLNAGRVVACEQCVEATERNVSADT